MALSPAQAVRAVSGRHLSSGGVGAQGSGTQICFLAEMIARNGACPRSYVASAVCRLSCADWARGTLDTRSNIIFLNQINIVSSN